MESPIKKCLRETAVCRRGRPLPSREKRGKRRSRWRRVFIPYTYFQPAGRLVILAVDVPFWSGGSDRTNAWDYLTVTSLAAAAMYSFGRQAAFFVTLTADEQLILHPKVFAWVSFLRERTLSPPRHAAF